MLKKLRTTGWCWLWVTLLIVAIDRYSKMLVIKHLMFYAPYPVLSFLNITMAANTGAAFSFLHNMSGWQNWFLGGLAVLVSIFILYWLSKLSSRERWVSIALCLILGGALGNAWDRAYYHFVIDFIDFHIDNWHFAIFNIADSAICIGAFMLLWHWVRHDKKS